jgi:hypothetical protein
MKAPDAKKVQVVGNFGLGKGGPWDMERGEDGVWSVTTPPVIAGFHYYTFTVDGVPINDPASENLLRQREADKRHRNPRKGRRFLLPQGRAPRRSPLALVQLQGNGPTAPRDSVYAAGL